MSARVWLHDPHSGGVKIPEAVKASTVRRILAHAAKHYADRYARLDVRFRGALCYIDAYTEPDATGTSWKITGETKEQYLDRLRNTPLHLCRLRHFGPDRWSCAFYTYSNERYEPCFLGSGEMIGTPEEGLDVGAVYLTE